MMARDAFLTSRTRRKTRVPLKETEQSERDRADKVEGGGVHAGSAWGGDVPGEPYALTAGERRKENEQI